MIVALCFDMIAKLFTPSFIHARHAFVRLAAYNKSTARALIIVIILHYARYLHRSFALAFCLCKKEQSSIGEHVVVPGPDLLIRYIVLF